MCLFISRLRPWEGEKSQWIDNFDSRRQMAGANGTNNLGELLIY